MVATKFPATVMVLGMVNNEGKVMSSHFFKVGLKITAQEGLRVL
jgi:hypothetical protein